MTVELFKQISNYTDKEGKERTATKFFIKCGSELIPIEVTYFKNDEKGDPNYRGRKMVLSSYAVEIPRKEKKDSANATKDNNSQNLVPLDVDLPV